jgi:hypothetical protein
VSNPFVIAVDFDQTLATGPFPQTGQPVGAAFEYLKIFQMRGARLILWTMRSDGRKQYTDPIRRDPLTAAVEFCHEHGVEFWAVNGNPEQAEWTGSPKAYAHVYIDDAAFGCPLVQLVAPDGTPTRPVVDWLKVGPGVLKLLDEHNERTARHQ